MKRVLKTLVVFATVLSLFGCSPKSKLLGIWTNGYGTTLEFRNDGTVLITMSILGYTQTTSMQYTADEYTFTLSEDGKSGLVVTYSIDKNEMTIKGTLLFDGTYLKTSKKVYENNNSGNTEQTGTFLSKEELDEKADYEFDQFTYYYSANHTDVLYGFLTTALRCNQISEHKYYYDYIYLVGDRYSYQLSFEVVRFTLTANSDKTYSVSTEEKTHEIIYLTSVNPSSMNVRRKPSTSSEIIGSIDTGERFRVNHIDCEDYSNGGEYIWYSLSVGDARWVADGITFAKDYYVFDNGISTKDITIYFGQRMVYIP